MAVKAQCIPKPSKAKRFKFTDSANINVKVEEIEQVYLLYYKIRDYNLYKYFY